MAKMKRMAALATALLMVVSLMAVPAFAKNDKGNGNGKNEPGTGQTQVHIHLEDQIGANKDSVTIIVDGQEYHGSIQGSKLEIEMDTTENGFDFGKDESMDVEYRNNSDGTSGTLTLTHQEGNGNNINKEHDEGLNNFRGSLKEEEPAPENETNPPVEPTDPPVIPTEPPVEPTDPPVEPTDPPVEPTDPPVEPTDPPVEPTDPPVEPTDPPVEPTDPPVEPTDPPVEPTEPPVEPTDPPVEPTDPPVIPTEPPVEPTDPPVVPTDPPMTPTEPQQNYDIDLTGGDGLIDIFDEDVPLADVPKTGDISTLWMVLSGLSAGGLILLKKKKED